MKKILCKVKQNLFGFILGTIIFGGVGVYAARLLTAQEVNAACNITVELDTCQYLMENTKFSNNSLRFGYWLETPLSNNSISAYYVFGETRSVNYYPVFRIFDAGVRPAIEVSITDIEY